MHRTKKESDAKLRELESLTLKKLLPGEDIVALRERTWQKLLDQGLVHDKRTGEGQKVRGHYQAPRKGTPKKTGWRRAEENLTRETTIMQIKEDLKEKTPLKKRRRKLQRIRDEALAAYLGRGLEKEEATTLAELAVSRSSVSDHRRDYMRNYMRERRKAQGYIPLGERDPDSFFEAKLKRAYADFEEFKTSLGCAACGYSKCGKSLEFHHKDPSTKLFLIGAYQWKYKPQQVIDEIAKCILLCSNCHKEVHCKRHDHKILAEDLIENQTSD